MTTYGGLICALRIKESKYDNTNPISRLCCRWGKKSLVHLGL